MSVNKDQTQTVHAEVETVSTVQQPDKEERFIAAVQALLFAAHEPLPPTMLRSLNGDTGWTLDNVVAEINRRLEQTGQPMRVRKVAGGYQMHLQPEFAPIVEAHLAKIRTQRLSRAGLETLAIIAYRQPCSAPMVEHIRGVSSDGVLRTLLERRMITVKGRSDGPGRPLLYGTTREFLEYFGIDSLEQLPREEELDELLTARVKEESESSDGADLFARLILKRDAEDTGDHRPFFIADVECVSEPTGWTETSEGFAESVDSSPDSDNWDKTDSLTPQSVALTE